MSNKTKPSKRGKLDILISGLFYYVAMTVGLVCLLPFILLTALLDPSSRPSSLGDMEWRIYKLRQLEKKKE
jgi:hypothetical protein